MFVLELNIKTHLSKRLSLSAAPAPVLDLHIRHSDETSLSAMWSHAPSGSRDGYFLTIGHGITDRRLLFPSKFRWFIVILIITSCNSQTTSPWTPGRWSQTWGSAPSTCSHLGGGTPSPWQPGAGTWAALCLWRGGQVGYKYFLFGFIRFSWVAKFYNFSAHTLLFI